MSTIQKSKRQLKATKKVQQDIVNYHYSVEQTKQQKKANDLIKPTHVETFKTLKTNLIMIDKLDDVEGYAQLINRVMKRFDVSKFKEKFPKRKQVDEIDIDQLCNFLGDKTESVDIEGVYGDAIYHSKILELLKRLKEKLSDKSYILSFSKPDTAPM